MDDRLVIVENVSKKYCRNLRRSLRYALSDISAELLARDRSLALRPDEFYALDNVSFEIRRGECLGIIGPNGSGKSTLLKLIAGLVKPDAGTITVRGRVASLIELGAGFNPVLTGRENIYVNASIIGLTKKEIDRALDDIIAFAELADAIDAPLHTYSSGMRARLGFAVAVHSKPDVLLVDEVLAVGDVGFRIRCLNKLRTLVAAEKSIVLVTHNLYEVRSVASRGIVINCGVPIYQGNSQKAVLAYLDIMSDRQSSVSIAGLRGSVVSLKDILVFGTNGELSGRRSTKLQQQITLRTGDSFGIQVHYSIHRVVPSGIQVSFMLRSAEGRMISGVTSKKLGVFLPGQVGEYRVAFKLADLPVLHGDYTIGVSFIAYDYSQQIDYLDPVLLLRVRNSDTDGLTEVGDIALNISCATLGI